MLLELLDMGFDVNPWGKKRSFYPKGELANCADDRAFLPMILFGTSLHAETFLPFGHFSFRF
ncbi:hypothetical protein [Klebsiella spallanzanii]|uniref:hypothetical protein n=1 Tax=Klebsiella spallanzanii TaxID=2587528 RepID=UPI0011190E9A|nr:hypothetical protein [Klebsiella spallanzanii]MDM4209717.1 hypothetical protein [Klebsiella spallanzanii]